MMNLFDELAEISRALEKAGIPYSLVGGLAYSVWVEMRTTEDIDLLVRREDWPRIVETLSHLGFEALAEPMEFANVYIRRLTKFSDEDVVVVDFIAANEETARGIERAVKVKARGTEFFIAPPDVIIALKKGRMSAKDLMDIEGLGKLLEGRES